MATPITTAQPPLEAPLPREVLAQLYSTMLKARLLSKRWRNALRMSEAILSGALANTEQTDQLLSAGPHPILEVLSGTPIHAVQSRPAQNKQLQSQQTQPGEPTLRVIASPGPIAPAIASGLALALKNAQSNSLVLAFLPAKVTGGPAWHQATAFAAANRLPVVFISDGTESRSARKHDGNDLSHWPFPTIAVDGRDVIAVYRVTKEAISAARRGHGPTLVDCVNFVAPGNRGRDNRDPIISFRGYLKRHNAWPEDSYRSLEEELSREISGK